MSKQLRKIRRTPGFKARHADAEHKERSQEEFREASALFDAGLIDRADLLMAAMRGFEDRL